MVDKPKSSLSWSLYQKQSFETPVPWCRLLSQSGQVSLLISVRRGGLATCADIYDQF